MMRPPAQLEYAPAAPSLRRMRNRRIVMLLAVLVLMVAGWRWGPTDWNQAVTLYWQRHCMNYVAPPGTLIYEDSPLKAAALAKADGDYVLDRPPMTTAYLRPRCLRELESRPSPRWVFLTTPDCTLFLHGMRTPSGRRRLIHVGGLAGELSNLTVDLGYQIFEPAGFFTQGRYVTGIKRPVHNWSASAIWARFGVGQIDPADPTHFTIPYSCISQPGGGTIDGWVQDDDTIEFIVRDGPGKRQ